MIGRDLSFLLLQPHYTKTVLFFRDGSRIGGPAGNNKNKADSYYGEDDVKTVLDNKDFKNTNEYIKQTEIKLVVCTRIR